VGSRVGDTSVSESEFEIFETQMQLPSICRGPCWDSHRIHPHALDRFSKSKQSRISKNSFRVGSDSGQYCTVHCCTLPCCSHRESRIATVSETPGKASHIVQLSSISVPRVQSMSLDEQLSLGYSRQLPPPNAPNSILCTVLSLSLTHVILIDYTASHLPSPCLPLLPSLPKANRPILTNKHLWNI